MLIVVYMANDDWAFPEEFPPCWCVQAPKQNDPNVVAFGFARRVDAEIAARVLPETGIDFGSTPKHFDRQWINFGGREAITKFVCERLQW